MVEIDLKTFMSIVDSILSTSSAAAQGLLQAPILIHGGEGKDITLVITSVVQVILLPECKKTISIQTRFILDG